MLHVDDGQKVRDASLDRHGWCGVGGVIDAFVENPLRVAANFAGDEMVLVRFSMDWK